MRRFNSFCEKGPLVFALYTLLAPLYIVGPLPTLRAAIVATGDIDPADPADWNSSTDGYVGKDTDGTLTVDGGDGLSFLNGYIGYYSDAKGTVTVSGADSTWTAGRSLTVGHYGNGTLNIIGGGAVVSTATGYEDCYIGRVSGSKGEVTVDGAESTLSIDGYLDELHVGISGDGRLIITNGGAVSSYYGSIGTIFGSTGVVTVDGDSSTWTNDDALYLGGWSYYSGIRGGNGTLSITGGGAVSNSYCLIGYFPSSSGEVAVDGAGSTWTNSSGISIGYRGSGVLNITGGGEVYNTNCSIGRYSGEGTATVSGADSTWINSGFLYVGNEDNGTLNIFDGGAVSNSNGCIGYDSGSTGVVTVDGTDSTWTNSGYLYVGESGSGALNLTGGGTVTAASVSINNTSLLTIDAGNDSQISINGGGGTITNNGTVRILAGAGVAADGTPYSPIAATTWDGGGVYQAVGGTWDGVNHKFYVSETLSGKAADMLSLDLSEIQRALIIDDVGDNSTGWQVGASFLHKTGENIGLDFTASVVAGEPLELLAETSGGEIVKGAWEFTVGGDGYAEDDPIYLSFAVGAGINRNDLHVWHFDGSAWTAFDAMDLTVNDGWASFTAAGLSGCAVTVPEPGTLALLAAGFVCATIYIQRKRR